MSSLKGTLAILTYLGVHANIFYAQESSLFSKDDSVFLVRDIHLPL